MHIINDIYKFIYFDKTTPLKGLAQVNSMGYAKIRNPQFFIQCGKNHGGIDQTIWQYTLAGTVIIEDQTGCYEVPEGACFIANNLDEQVSYYYPDGGQESYECLWLTTIGSSVELCDDLVAKYGRVFQFKALPKSFQWVKHKMRNAKLIQQEALSELQAISYFQLLTNDLLGSRVESGDSANKLCQLARQTVLNFIHLPLNVQGLAKELRVTPVHLARIFAKQGLSSPRHFINELKTDHAVKLLLNTRMSIKEISTSLGYDTSSHFARSFSRITGKSPGGFR